LETNAGVGALNKPLSIVAFQQVRVQALGGEGQFLIGRHSILS
jgi:hypothetical protein